MDEFFDNENIFLRALEPEDLGVLYKWENKTSLWQYGATLLPYSKFAIKQYIADYQQDIYQSRQLRMMIVEKINNKCVGTIDLYDFDPLNAKAAIGILIDEYYQKRGYAMQALQCVENYVFNRLNLHQIYAFVPEQNLHSLSLFKKAKYEQTAILKDWLLIGKTLKDVIVMQKIKNI